VGNTVFWRWNLNAPTADAGVINTSSSTVALAPLLRDDDGDALWVTWGSVSPAVSGTTFGTSGPEQELASLGVSTATICSMASPSLTVPFTVSDGFAPHTHSDQFTINFTGTTA